MMEPHAWFRLNPSSLLHEPSHTDCEHLLLSLIDDHSTLTNNFVTPKALTIKKELQHWWSLLGLSATTPDVRCHSW